MPWFDSLDPVTVWTYLAPELINGPEALDEFNWTVARDSFASNFNVDVVDLEAVYPDYDSAGAATPAEKDQPLR